jgi:hypothetical protein
MSSHVHMTHFLINHHIIGHIVHTLALLNHFNWELFDHPPYSLEIALSHYLFTYPKNWFRSQHLNSKEELADGVKTCLS